jgi:hypothetical protein
MSDVIRFALEDDTSVLVEVEEGAYGIERVGRGDDGVAEAGRVVSDALASVREAAREALESLRGLAPDGLEMEFGIKLSGEVGAIIAKTSTEGHFTVKMTWDKQ